MTGSLITAGLLSFKLLDPGYIILDFDHKI